MEANQALGQLTGSFDVVFLDPPYAKEEIMDNIQQLCQRKLLAEDVMVVCERTRRWICQKEIADPGHLEAKSLRNQ